MLKQPFLLILGLILALNSSAQTFRFDFTDSKNGKLTGNAIKITPNDIYSSEKGYGYDFQEVP